MPCAKPYTKTLHQLFNRIVENPFTRHPWTVPYILFNRDVMIFCNSAQIMTILILKLIRTSTFSLPQNSAQKVSWESFHCTDLKMCYCFPNFFVIVSHNSIQDINMEIPQNFKYKSKWFGFWLCYVFISRNKIFMLYNKIVIVFQFWAFPRS